ncbi:MAG TPA: TfoX/Sxy family protein [Kofleriaceae bacterium]|nr:TfoX/Sxy family protein [Kofleriaceae bacterium]
MAWVKIPKEHHELLRAALPRDPRVTTLQMFGGLCGMVNGNMFGGTFGRSAIARLGPADLAEALELDGATVFDPMGRGTVMRDMVFFPESIMDEPDELRAWMKKALAYSATLPAKKKKPPAKKRAAAKKQPKR